jgi:hypothetical protein
MDGVGEVYEALRGKPFAAFLQRIETVRTLAPFGINYVVNSRTLPHLDSATRLAAEAGATEFLLLPQQPSRGKTGIDSQTERAFRRWVLGYHGGVRLAVSEDAAADLPTADPFPAERGLRAYAHIDACGILKRTSYHNTGITIGPDGLMSALQEFRILEQETTL